MKAHFLYLVCGSWLAALVKGSAHATNGMALPAYGAIASGFGGASQAYDNGNAGAINNAATLALMEPGRRLEVGATLMHVDAATWTSGVPKVDSEAEWFLMPDLSYYDIDARSQLNAAYVHAFEKSETNTSPLVGLSSSLAQDSLSLSYSHRF